MRSRARVCRPGRPSRNRRGRGRRLTAARARVVVVPAARDHEPEYQREHGQYPERLTELAPKYLKTIPQDRFTDQPLKYQRQDEGYLLYTVGANRKDDKGQDASANKAADDWAIRVPMTPEL